MAGRKREWLKKRMSTLMAGKENRMRGSGRRVSVFSAAWNAWRQRGRRQDAHIVVVVLDSLRYNVLWVVEAVVVVATLCFFYVRFGFRL
ncbi:hypothetical protein Cni_G23275 [Canna indica]|uniref:Transmembrane protein n=1 Tax=Canna indica TaxID=4628 RepID=A0AAQ3KU33_9LILI|nr:hypothetical protein Cni_G23275 [Canna indica]